ncbi:MAG: hypothetical protein JWQ97_3501, partial [Phenylobacterium sp.]|nr:hypothetical protein [Phenylobacterium sp.]
HRLAVGVSPESYNVHQPPISDIPNVRSPDGASKVRFPDGSQ